MSRLRTVVSFRSSAFNTTEPRDYFINEICFGDDLARWLIRELNARGVHALDEPGQEDFGWYLTYYLGEVEYQLIIGFRADETGAEGDWVCWLERSAGLLASRLGARKRGLQPEAVQVVHAALTSSADIQEVRWHFREDFDAGREEKAAGGPLAA